MLEPSSDLGQDESLQVNDPKLVTRWKGSAVDTSGLFRDAQYSGHWQDLRIQVQNQALTLWI